MKVGEIIQHYLSKNNLSQRQFAKNCGLSNGYISMLINNINPKTGKPMIPSLSALMSLAYGLGMTLDELLNNADDIEVNIAKLKKIPNTKIDEDEEKILKLIKSLPVEKRKQAIDYIKYLSQSSN